VMAWLLCISNATWIRWFDKRFPIWGHNINKSHEFLYADKQAENSNSTSTGHEDDSKAGRDMAKGCLSGSRALECNPAHPDWEHTMPKKSLLRRLSGPIINQESQEQTTEPKATVSDSGACQADHQLSSCLHSCLWYVALPLYYIAGGLVRVLPAVLTFIMLGGTCKLPPISYPHCSSNWHETTSFSTPAIEALAMTLLLFVLARDIWRHLQQLYYFFGIEVRDSVKAKATDGGVRTLACFWSRWKRNWKSFCRGVDSALVRLLCPGFCSCMKAFRIRIMIGCALRCWTDCCCGLTGFMACV
jgi:hypothetical protein